MAIMDAEVMFSNRQAITATGASTNIWDSGPYGRPVIPGAPTDWDVGVSDIDFIVQVVAAFNNLTSLAVAWQTSDDPAFGSGVVTLSTETKVLADLKAGARFQPFKLPRSATKRYHRLMYTVVGTAPTQGAVTAAAATADNAWFRR